MEAKKQGAGEEDLSMEEILQSIRRIIADDNEGGKEAAKTNGNDLESPVATSDILELTDMIEDDGSITDLKAAPAEPAKAVDVLDNIDAALAPEPKVEAKPDTPVAQPPVVTPVVTPEPPEAKKMPADDKEALISKSAEDAALSSLSKLAVPEEKPVPRETSPSPVFRSGTTVEDMVEEMIRPMLKEWLDTNLPIIVERIVEREVTRLSRR